jgi:type IV pilus assembly protein PilV
METIVIHNNKGFTLIEFLVAIVILMVGLLGLLQTVNYAIVHNMTNQLRQGAIVLADELMQQETAKRFDSIPSGGTVPVNPKPRRLINGALHTYDVDISYAEPTMRTKSIALQVSWTYKGQQYQHGMSSYVSQFE